MVEVVAAASRFSPSQAVSWLITVRCGMQSYSSDMYDGSRDERTNITSHCHAYIGATNDKHTTSFCHCSTMTSPRPAIGRSSNRCDTAKNSTDGYIELTTTHSHTNNNYTANSSTTQQSKASFTLHCLLLLGSRMSLQLLCRLNLLLQHLLAVGLRVLQLRLHLLLGQ